MSLVTPAAFAPQGGEWSAAAKVDSQPIGQVRGHKMQPAVDPRICLLIIDVTGIRAI